MPAVGETIRVEGLREFQLAFKAADRALTTELRSALREVAEPVRAAAERLAVAGIPTIGVPWSRMRIGVTQSSVYVAPRQRGGKGTKSRPNLAGLLLDRSMLPALRQNETRVVAGIERALGSVGQAWERV